MSVTFKIRPARSGGRGTVRSTVEWRRASAVFHGALSTGFAGPPPHENMGRI